MNNRVNVLDHRQIFILSTLPEGSWFGDFNAFLNVKSGFTFVAHYEPDDTEFASDDQVRIMLLMCPVEKFLQLLKDYPQTNKWMIERSILRRNYFKQIQDILYKRHEVDKIFGHAKYRGRVLEEAELQGLHERVASKVTRQSQKININPLDLDDREKLTDDDICELNVGTEIDDANA